MSTGVGGRHPMDLIGQTSRSATATRAGRSLDGVLGRGPRGQHPLVAAYHADPGGADLQPPVAARCQGAILPRTDLSGAWLHGADLSRSDLRGSDPGGLDPRVVTLTGAVIDHMQACAIAVALGLEIRDGTDRRSPSTMDRSRRR
jgi:hypothetical protein